MPEIYLDNSATTRPYNEVIELMGSVQSTIYGNPSSLHTKGLEAEKLLREARCSIAQALRCRDDEIIFTSGGTESNNVAVKGAAYRCRRRGSHIITSAIEHPSVIHCCRQMEEEGFTVTYLPVDDEGTVRLKDLEQALTDQTILVSIIHVNNEIGTIQPLEKIGALIKNCSPKTLFHVDGVQSLGKVAVEFEKWQADLFSCSAHKIHGPKGVGALWVGKKTLLQPLMHGGEQEGGRRPGTENVAGIAGFGLAAGLTTNKMRANAALMYSLKEQLLRGLRETGLEVLVNGPPPRQSAPHLLNLTFPGIKGEVLLRALEQQGIYASSGSACHSRHPKPSHVLRGIGLSEKMIAAALRFSFSGFTDTAEINYVIEQTGKAVNELKAMLP